MPKEDKATIRERLIDSALDEPEERLLVQNAIVIAKITRFEFPHDWPDALNLLLKILRSQPPPSRLTRALTVLHHMVKELSTARLQRNRQNLQAATPEIVHVLNDLYTTTVTQWLSDTSAHARTLMSQSFFVIKVLRRLLVAGYDHPNRDADVALVWQRTQQHLALFDQLVRNGTPHVELVEKHMVQLSKLHHEMAKQHPAAFAMLPGSIELTKAYWGLVRGFGQDYGSQDFATRGGRDIDLNEDRSATEKIALKGLLIIRACVKMIHNPTQTFKQRSLEDTEERSQAIIKIQHDFLTQACVTEMIETLVTRFFVFRARDLKEWEEEPEEWQKREGEDVEDWEFSVRSCSEKLFLDLAINYKEVMVQPLLQVFYSVADPANDNVLLKDSVYTAIGLAAPVLHEQLDFDTFVSQVLVAEVQKQVTGYNIVRRRAAILVSQWAPVKVSERSWPSIFQIFLYLLDRQEQSNDLIVRITAGRQFKLVCDVWEFRVDLFLPYAEPILLRLLQLIREVELTETRMALLDTMSNIVARLDHEITPFAAHIVNVLPLLWSASGEEHLMKQAILAILARLVSAMKAEGQPIHSIAYPIIRGAIEPGSETGIYLLDDAMELWSDILIQTAEPAPSDLLALVPFLYPIYELGSENLRKALEITESYVLLAPSHMLAPEVTGPMLHALSKLLGKVRQEANGLVCNLIESLIRIAGQVGGDSAVERITASLVESSIFTALLEGLRGSWVSHCTTGPNRKEPVVDGIVETDYFSILSRLILANTEAFLFASRSSMPMIAGTNGKWTSSRGGEELCLHWLLAEWFSHFENVGDTGSRKLMCLALTKLLDVQQPVILHELQSLMSMWTDVITALREDAGDGKDDSLVCEVSNPADTNPEYAGVPEAPEETRRRALTNIDPIHTISTPAYVKWHLGRAVAICGGEQALQAEWLVNVDREVLNSFVALGVM